MICVGTVVGVPLRRPTGMNTRILWVGVDQPEVPGISRRHWNSAGTSAPGHNLKISHGHSENNATGREDSEDSNPVAVDMATETSQYFHPLAVAAQQGVRDGQESRQARHGWEPVQGIESQFGGSR